MRTIRITAVNEDGEVLDTVTIEVEDKQNTICLLPFDSRKSSPLGKAELEIGDK